MISAFLVSHLNEGRPYFFTKPLQTIIRA